MLTASEYVLRDMDGAEKAIQAEGLRDAKDQAKDWVQGGSYGDIESTIWVDVDICEQEEDGSLITVATVTVAIDPEEPPCLPDEEDERLAAFPIDAGEKHRWRTPHRIVGGSKENPGVWGHAGGTMGVSVCTRCGCGKHWDGWAQRPDTGEQGLDSVSFTAKQFFDELSWHQTLEKS